MKISTNFKIFYLILIFLISTSLFSQKSNRGKDFYITFPPNYHSNPDNDPSEFRDSLFIFISANHPTNGQIYSRDINSKVDSIQFTIDWIFR